MRHKKSHPVSGWLFLFTAKGRDQEESTFRVVSLGRVTEEVGDFVFCGMKGLTQGTVLTTQIVVSLLGPNEFRLQAEEFVHDRFTVCLRFFKLFFEQQFHDVKVGFGTRFRPPAPRSSQQLSRSVL